MVIDTNKFVAGTPPQPDFLTVLEQIPGTIVSQDQTFYLINNDYFPSYNRPFYPEIFNLTDQMGLVRKRGDHYLWFVSAE
jgi:hypothetical protein